MLYRIAAFVMLLSLPFIAAPSNAQGLDPFLQTLNDFNDIKPKQNPNWERARETMKSRILDNKNKVVGELNDIILTPQGAINSLNVEMNRLQMGDVSLNYANLDIDASPRSYQLGYDDGQIEDFLPELLANIETAAGNTADSISVDALIGSNVSDTNGRRIAKVEDVLFSESGDRAEALLIRVNFRSVRGESVALPFSSAEYIPSGSRFDVKLSKRQADTIIEFAGDL